MSKRYTNNIISLSTGFFVVTTGRTPLRVGDAGCCLYVKVKREAALVVVDGRETLGNLLYTTARELNDMNKKNNRAVNVDG